MPAMQSAPRSRARRFPGLGAASAVALVFWLIYGLGRPDLMTLRGLLLMLTLGLTTYGGVRLAMAALDRRLADPPRAGLGRALAYFGGGVTGFLAGAALAAPLYQVKVLAWDRNSLVAIVVVGGLAVFVALSLAGFERLRRSLAESAERLKEAEFAQRELDLARAIQQRLLPPPTTSGDGYVVAARNLAARTVAGDFYDVFRLPDGALGLVVADVAGKGIAAGLVMATVKARLPLLAAERSVADTLGALNDRLVEELSSREFVALAYCRFEPASGALELAVAGLPQPYLVGAAGATALEVPGPRFPLGLRSGLRYETLRAALSPGDRLLLCTDGLAEAPLPGGEPLGYETLLALVEAVPRSASPDAWVDALLAAVRARTLAELADDWTALLLERVAGKR
jgi:serine phosphatase RsbU (regulator of sigma subunit)